MPIDISTKEEKTEMKTHPATITAKISKNDLKSYKPFCAFYLSIHFTLLLR